MSVLTERAVYLYRTLRTVASRWKHHGVRSAYTFATWWVRNRIERFRLRFSTKKTVCCPCCGWTGPLFLTLDCGQFTVPMVECPRCGGHERHRALYLFLKEHHPEFAARSGTVLHFAPEKHVRALLEENPARTIVSVDYARDAILAHPTPKFQTDMLAIGLTPSSVDLIFCLHVLEHVPDDRKGVGEMHRVLKPGGTAYIMVPYVWEGPHTIEYGKPDPTIFDHVRGYSPHDFGERLAPFAFEEIAPKSYLTPEERTRYRVPDNQIIYRCTK